MVPEFKGWPSDQITVTFWFWSPDACRPGVPVSYALPGSSHGEGIEYILSAAPTNLDCVQVMMVPEFKGWPSDQITVTFWMWSLDACRPGVPISYALPGSSHGEGDNEFLLFDYTSWCAPAC